jgi:hypothetical protein
VKQTENTRKLSDYILAGIKQTRPLTGQYFEAAEPQPKACPIGAACYAKEPDCGPSMRYNFDAEVVSQQLFPELVSQVRCTVPEPYYVAQDWYLQDLIQHLNDALKWRRDRIARYVKKLGY